MPGAKHEGARRRACIAPGAGGSCREDWSGTRIAMNAAPFVVLAIALAGPALAEPVGRVDHVENSVTAEQAGARRALAVDDALDRADVLTSGDAARLQATLEDDTRITLGENAVLRIDAFLYAPEAGDGALALRVLEGTFLFVGGRVEDVPGATVTISTPFATMGIRGTTVWGGPLDGAFAVYVSEGEVTVTNAGQTVTLGPGEGTTMADPASPPGPVTDWPGDRIARALATVALAQ
jgi:hypothetical protein